MLRYEDYCQLCSRPDWWVAHETDDDHSDQWVPAQQVKAAKAQHPGVTGQKLWVIMAQSPCCEVNAA